MESDGLMYIMTKLYAKSKGKTYLDTIVTDDDTKMKKYITHPKYNPWGLKNIGGSLPDHIPEPG